MRMAKVLQVSMETTAIVKIVAAVLSVCTTLAGIVWGYAKLNARADENKRDIARTDDTVKTLDSKTGEAVDKLYERINQDRERYEKREDRIHEKIDAFNKDLSELHKDVLRALPVKGE